MRRTKLFFQHYISIQWQSWDWKSAFLLLSFLLILYTASLNKVQHSSLHASDWTPQGIPKGYTGGKVSHAYPQMLLSFITLGRFQRQLEVNLLEKQKLYQLLTMPPIGGRKNGHAFCFCEELWLCHVPGISTAALLRAGSSPGLKGFLSLLSVRHQQYKV